MQAVSKPTINRCITRWKNEAVEALANQLKSGRQMKANDEYIRSLLQIIEKELPEMGYDFAIWTNDCLRAHLKKETGINLSSSWFRVLLNRKGYQYRRPKHDLGHLQDKDAKEKAAVILQR